MVYTLLRKLAKMVSFLRSNHLRCERAPILKIKTALKSPDLGLENALLRIIIDYIPDFILIVKDREILKFKP